MQCLQGTVGKHKLKLGIKWQIYPYNQILGICLIFDLGGVASTPLFPRINRRHAKDNTTQNLVKVSP